MITMMRFSGMNMCFLHYLILKLLILDISFIMSYMYQVCKKGKEERKKYHHSLLSLKI